MKNWLSSTKNCAYVNIIFVNGLSSPSVLQYRKGNPVLRGFLNPNFGEWQRARSIVAESSEQGGGTDDLHHHCFPPLFLRSSHQAPCQCHIHVGVVWAPALPIWCRIESALELQFGTNPSHIVLVWLVSSHLWLVLLILGACGSFWMRIAVCWSRGVISWRFASSHWEGRLVCYLYYALAISWV